ncbi:PhoH family protein [Nitrosococcus halophilus Nc 4]|uniref:PhoH-like protein n=1 Tax=Nitrosococcus halophilus (strain Nc4) TaxID=472759 RepID=D5C3K5_NITHN|nr:PhoH family protein [Nitrosococcus halophilus]ADE16912.1 PhoH family protein [Nitrosococcus halophilus Nc 4]
MNEHPPSDHPESNDFVLEPLDNERLANLCGQMDEHLRQIERGLGVEINNRGNLFRVLGDSPSVQTAGDVIRRLYDDADEARVTPARVHLLLQEAGHQEYPLLEEQEEVLIRTRRGTIKGRSPRQIRYLRNILTHDINFGIGPAGTGKTYLAVACAVEALEKERVRRLLLVRPAVEAGERLGFLPGDLAQKIDPYLRPLYDALYEMLGFERVAKLIERHVIEVAPLAYMRGRTLNESFIILDEAQNTTIEQMKMFLTRLGYGSIAVVTGDVTQIDLPKGQPSGLRHVTEVLKDVNGISFTFFQARDVVRHPLVQRVVQAYERFGRGNGPGL